MGAKESRIGFLSYEEALRRGEGEGSGRAAGEAGDGLPAGGWPRDGVGGRAREAEGEDGRCGDHCGGRRERSYGKRCLGIGTVWKGAKLCAREGAKAGTWPYLTSPVLLLF